MTPLTHPVAAAPRTLPPLSPDDLDRLVLDFGACAEGYTDDDINALLPRWERLLQRRLVCGWTSLSRTNGLGLGGFTGDSELLMQTLDDPTAYQPLPAAIWAYLLGECPDDDRAGIRPSKSLRAFWLGTFPAVAASATGTERVWLASTGHNAVLAAR
jgi:hypothetical protein